MGLATEDGGRAAGLHRPGQHLAHDVRLVISRGHAKKFSGGAQLRDTDGQGVLGHGMDVGEMSLIHLLLAADCVQFDDFDGVRVIEMSHGRIVKGEVSVVADAEEAQVDGVGLQEAGVSFAFPDGFEGIASQVMELAGRNAPIHLFVKVMAETGGVMGGEAEVFIHVKEHDTIPLQARLVEEMIEKEQLGLAGGEDDAGGFLFLERGDEVPARDLGGVLSQNSLVLMGPNSEGIDLFLVKHADGFGTGQGILGHERRTMTEKGPGGKCGTDPA